MTVSLTALLRPFEPLTRWLASSLRLRLMLGAALWVSVALVVALLVLRALFQMQMETQVKERMQTDLDQLAANLEVAEDGHITLLDQLAEPRFQKPLSGLYWQVQVYHPTGDELLLRSRSLWDAAMPLPPLPSLQNGTGGILTHHVLLSTGTPLLVVERQITLTDDERRLRLAIGWDSSGMATLFDSFLSTLLLSFAVLAAGIMVAAWGQVSYGLVPFERLRLALAAVSDGEATAVKGTYPCEVMPLVQDLNSMLDRNGRMVAQASEAAGNLAHALKTPLAIIANEAQMLSQHGDPQAAALLLQQVDAMRRHIDHHLARARAQAGGEARGLRTPVEPSLQRLTRVFSRLHPQDLELVMTSPPPFRGDARTLEEILGNLLENACKWGRQRVRLTARACGSALELLVEDDGCGIPPDQVDTVLRRGQRLDESKPGSGLGLSIVDDLTRAAGGTLDLIASPDLGGLCARLHLPAADLRRSEEKERIA